MKNVGLKKLLLILIPLVTIIYTILIDYIRHNPAIEFSYLDNQIYWESLYRLSLGQVLYKDFFWEYGIYYLLIGMPTYLLFGKTYLAYMITRLIFIPIIAAIMLAVMGKKVLNSKEASIFLTLTVIMGGLNFANLRHLIPELGVILIVFGYHKNKTDKYKNVIYGGMLVGVSFLGSIEYAIAAVFSLTGYLLFNILKKNNFKPDKLLLKSFLPGLSIVAIYFGYLTFNGALEQMFLYFSQSGESFYTVSPCSEYFPRFWEVTQGRISLIKYINLLKYYFIPAFLITYSFYLIFTKNRKLEHTFALVLFSLLSYVRPIVTPCDPYLSYGIPLILLTSFYLYSNSTGKLKKVTLFFIFYILVFTLPPYLNRYLSPIKKEITVYSDIAKVRLKPEDTQSLKQSVNYINANHQNKTVFTYPHGPFLQTAKLKPGLSTTSTLYYQLVPSVKEKIIKEIEAYPPDIVIINGINAHDYLSSFNNLVYNIVQTENNIHFIGYTSEIEEFIMKNYMLDKKFNKVWILTRDDSSRESNDLLVESKIASFEISTSGLNEKELLDKSKVYLPINEESELLFKFDREELVDAKYIKIPIHVEFPIERLKYLFKFGLQYQVGTVNKGYRIPGGFLDGNPKNIYILLISSLFDNTEQEEIYVKITVSKNIGFINWPKYPKRITIQPPSKILLNKDIEIDDLLIKTKESLQIFDDSFQP